MYVLLWLSTQFIPPAEVNLTENDVVVVEDDSIWPNTEVRLWEGIAESDLWCFVWSLVQTPTEVVSLRIASDVLNCFCF